MNYCCGIFLGLLYALSAVGMQEKTSLKHLELLNYISERRDLSFSLYITDRHDKPDELQEVVNLVFNGNPVLFCAVEYQLPGVVKNLLSAKADVNARTSKGESALEKAVDLKLHSIVGDLIDHGAQCDQKLYAKYEKILLEESIDLAILLHALPVAANVYEKTVIVSTEYSAIKKEIQKIINKELTEQKDN